MVPDAADTGLSSEVDVGSEEGSEDFGALTVGEGVAERVEEQKGLRTPEFAEDAFAGLAGGDDVAVPSDGNKGDTLVARVSRQGAVAHKENQHGGNPAETAVWRSKLGVLEEGSEHLPDTKH